MNYQPTDYDRHGLLTLPVLFWGILLLQARSWVLFIVAGASREQGAAILNIFYPDSTLFLLSLIPGIPAVLAFLLSGRRLTLPRLWRSWYWVLAAAQTCILVMQANVLVESGGQSPGAVALMAADLFALWWWLFHRRLRACFQVPAE